MEKSNKRSPPAERDRRRTEATSYDVARRAGVSQSAVSRCFRPGASVAPKTRARILKAAQELGYQPNALAQGLISGRTNVIALLISNLTNLYYPEVLATISQGLSDRGMRVLLFALRNESEVDLVLDQLWRHRVDGAIVAARLSDAQIQQFEKKSVALVLYNRVSNVEPAASICCDSATGEALLVDRLLSAGHRSFAIIAGPEDSYVGEERLRAAVARLAQAGLASPPIARGEYSYESGGEAFRELMAVKARYDALICVNDTMAIGAIDCAREEFGLSIPDDLSVVGFDGVDPARWASYRLTSIRQPVGRMAEAAIETLLQRIENPDITPERRLFSGQLIVGRSARLGEK
jgi:DNA-binding LacI/PurR family transcriptional regulator